jgi:hypothetical protein
MNSDLYREVKTGGRWAQRSIAIGDAIGNSKVLRDLGISSHCRRFEVTCEYCMCKQIRSTGQLNAALRNHKKIACPRCVSEGRVARKLEFGDFRLERVLAGGPIYSHYEMQDICDAVLNDLIAEWGYPEEPKESFEIADGWPYSAGGAAKDAIESYMEDAKFEHRYQSFKEKQAAEKRDYDYRIALKQHYLREAITTSKRDRDYRVALKQHYLREERNFGERAKEAAEALVEFTQVGGSIESGGTP